MRRTRLVLRPFGCLVAQQSHILILCVVNHTLNCNPSGLKHWLRVGAFLTLLQMCCLASIAWSVESNSADRQSHNSFLNSSSVSPASLIMFLNSQRGNSPG